MSIILKAEKLSKWYGNVLGISEISIEITSGIHGLLGPNGAGKSTFLKIASGQLKPNIGKIKIFGEDVFNNYKLFSKIGFCPEYDSYYKEITGLEFMLFSAKCHGFEGVKAEQAAESALKRVGLTENKGKLISSYSLGMRQKLKLATSIVHDPEFLILDEPLKGIDPIWRVKIIEMIKEFESQGKTIIVSSHILPEVEAMTNNVILIHQGKIFAQGDIQEIRDLIDTHPHKISVKCDKHRLIADKMINSNFVLNLQFKDKENEVIINTNNREIFFDSLMGIVVDNNINVQEITSPDDNLQAVFDYLIGR